MQTKLWLTLKTKFCRNSRNLNKVVFEEKIAYRETCVAWSNNRKNQNVFVKLVGNVNTLEHLSLKAVNKVNQKDPLTPNRTHMWEILARLDEISQVFLWPFSKSDISSQATAWSWITHTTPRLLHESNSWGIQFASHRETVEILEMSNGSANIVITTASVWYVPVLVQKVLNE